jgi:multicomponent Na+:H+ antiporter subunit D
VIEQIPPGLILIVGGLLLPLMPKDIRKVLLVVVPAVGLAHLLQLPADHVVPYRVFDYDLTLVKVDKLSRIFGIIFHIAAFLTAIYTLHDDDPVQQVAGLMYSGAAIAATFAGDLITLFVFWEGTAITSVFLIWARRTERSYRTGMRYLVWQVGSGVALLAGAILYFQQSGSLDIEPWTHEGHQLRGMFAFDHFSDASPAQLLIFLSLGIKSAFPLLHNWLQDAYPEATVGGTVWLSAFTTKLAIYALCRLFAGSELLIPIGAMMTAFPIFYAVIENDLRKVLAYSLNNQLGFMVVGIGIGTELAINGTTSHAFAHILYKGLLFMGMGAVLYRAGTIKGSELGGLYKDMPLTMVFTSIGAAAISAFPLFSGFVSKSMILTAAAEGHHTVVFLILLFASAGVFHHSGIKIPYFAFFAHDSGRRVKEAPLNMLIAMGAAAFLCIAIGCFPAPLYRLLPFDMNTLHWVPYNLSHVVTQLQLLLYSAAAFVFLQKMGWYPPELKSVNVDVEWVYRKGLKDVALTVGRALDTGYTSFRDELFAGAWQLVDRVKRWHSPGGPLGEPWPIGTAALAAAIMLILFLALGWL